MKLKKLSEKGYSHIVIPILIVFGIAIIGIHVLTISHAATCKSFTLQQGSNGQCVMYIQQIANAVFPKSSPIPMNGQYNSQTVSLIKQFQASSQVSANGIVSSQTWNKLCASTRYSPNVYGSWTAAEAAGC